MGKRFVLVSGTILVAAIGVGAFFLWQQGAPKRQAIQTLTQLQAALKQGQPDAVLNRLQIPPAYQGRTRAEQADFAVKALSSDEVSPEGIARLAKNGQFGPLLQLFPAEGPQWAAQAGVSPSNCVAFVSTAVDPRAEVVFHVETGAWRVVRLNNVK